MAIQSTNPATNTIVKTFEEMTENALGKNPTVQLTNGSPDQSEYVLHKFTSNK